MGLTASGAGHGGVLVHSWAFNGTWIGPGNPCHAAYNGLHLGYGRVFDLTEAVSLDKNTKWQVTPLKGGDRDRQAVLRALLRSRDGRRGGLQGDGTFPPGRPRA